MNDMIVFVHHVDRSSLNIFFFSPQLVDHLPGVAVSCTPAELNIRLQDKNDTHKYQWTFNLIFKVSEILRI